MKEFWSFVCVCIVVVEVCFCMYWLIKWWREERKDKIEDNRKEKSNGIELWVARDEAFGPVWGFDHRPEWWKRYKMWCVSSKHDGDMAYKLPSGWFTELTPENSPQQIRIEFVKKNKAWDTIGKQKQPR